MKRFLKVMVIFIILFSFTIKANAEEVYYTNDKGVAFTLDLNPKLIGIVSAKDGNNTLVTKYSNMKSSLGLIFS